MMSPSSSLRERVLAAAAAHPSPTRPQATRAVILAVVVSLSIALAVVELAGGFAHSAGRPLLLSLTLASGWTLGAAFVTWLVMTRRGSTLSRRPLVLAVAAVVTPLALFWWMDLFSGNYEEPFKRAGYRCLAFTLVIAATPLVSLLRLRRGVEPRHPSTLGAAFGAVSGAWAAVAIHLWCPLTNRAHVLLGHVAPVALLVAIGMLVGSRMLRRA